ncbi:zonadhesin-like [Lineus longissimus]|uniref:zonadhesin-like n=1 Tax=Lineus longissimus TaxID=88925 RepID=UPI00315D5B40
MKSPLAWVAIVVTAILAQAESTVPVNLALRKTCLQFHETSGGKANRAVDGNKNNEYYRNSCTHSSVNGGDNVNNNWWAVDLVHTSLIQKVVLYNRGDCCGSRLSNFDIVVTHTRPTPGRKLVFSSSEVCAHKTGAVPQGQSQAFNCNKQLEGRYVAVVRSRSQHLTLCEVEVFGTPIPRCIASQKRVGTKCVARCIASQKWVGSKCVARCIASQKWVGTKCVARCIASQKWVGTKCVARCIASQKWVGTKCVARCIASQKWVGTKCVARCIASQKWVGTKCVARCIASQKWVGTKCVARCIASQKWVGTKCVARCIASQKWVGTKCVARCIASQKWVGTKCVARCIASQKWVGTKCVAKCPSPQKYNTVSGTCEAKTCRCFAGGDPHYYQYDGHRIDFMGKCKYTFTKLKDDFKTDKCYFNVEEKNVHIGNPRVSFVGLLDVTVEDMTFRYSQQAAKVSINGVDRTKSNFPITIRTRKGTDVKVSYANRQFQVEATACGMITTYRRYFIETFISSTIGTKVEGICGTCNDNRNDDLIAKGQTKATTKNAFSSSWSVPDDSGLQQQTNCEAADVSGDCTVAWATKVKDNNHCGYITDTNGPFKACIASGLVNLKQYQDSCEFDVCFYSKEATAAKDVPDVVCKNLAVFADDCAKQGLGSVWRRANFCPLNCEANASYTPKLYPACEKTCQQRNAPADCVAGEPEDGCSCNEGYFRLGNDCVLPGKCGCDAIDGQHIDSGNSVVMKGCTVKYECTAQGTLRQLAFPACHKDASCSTVNGQYACKCNDGFNGDGHSCQTNCPKAEEKWDTKDSKCVLRCPDAKTEWDEKQGKCVNRCSIAQLWEDTSKKCVERCVPADKWNEASKKCEPRCQVDQLWKMDKCVNRCGTGEKWHGATNKCYQDPMYPTTTEGNAGGAGCVIPFLFGGKWQEDCVPGANNKKWCGTTENYDQDKKWGYCSAACRTSAGLVKMAGDAWTEGKEKVFCNTDGSIGKITGDHPSTTGGTGGGAGCVFPFLDGTVYRGSCQPYNGQRWCGTVKDGTKWGYCPAACRTSASLVKMIGDAWTEGKEKVFCNTDGSIGKITGDYPSTTGGTGGGAGCVFPFLDGTVYRGSCQPYNGQRWCGTVKDGTKWGYCPVSCTTQKGERKIVGESWMFEKKKYFCDQNAEVFVIKDENINTKAGGKCVFPFKYNGKYYGGCTGSNPWCATTPDYDTDAKWGYCHLIATCLPQDQKQVTAGETWSSGGMEYSCGRDGKVRKNVKTSAGNCHFPFNYKGSTYEACTEVASAGKPWCYVDASESAYGYC